MSENLPLYYSEEEPKIEPFKRANFEKNVTRFFKEVIAIDIEIAKNSGRPVKQPFPFCIENGPYVYTQHVTEHPEFKKIRARKDVKDITVDVDRDERYSYLRINFNSD
jgi:hypothetical protein